MADALLEYRKQLEPLREALREADSLGRAAPLEDAECLRRRLQRGSSTLDRLIEDGQAGKVPLEESDLEEAKKLRSEVKSHRTKLRNRINKRKQLGAAGTAAAAEASDEGSVAEPAAAVAAPAAAAPEVSLVDTAAPDAAAPTGAGGPPEVPSIDVAAPTGAGGPPEVPSADVAAPAGVADAVAFCERLVRRRKRVKASECDEPAHRARPDRPRPQGGPRALGPPPGPQLPGQAHAGPQGDSAGGRAASIRGADLGADLGASQEARGPAEAPPASEGPLAAGAGSSGAPGGRGAARWQEDRRAAAGHETGQEHHCRCRRSSREGPQGAGGGLQGAHRLAGHAGRHR